MSRPGTRFLGPALALLFLGLLLPAGSGAQVVEAPVLNTTPVAVRSIPARFAGQLTVDFHGDAASGCASRGLCGYAGTVSWRPPPIGQLQELIFREHGRLSYELGLLPEGESDEAETAGAVNTAEVHWAASDGGAVTSNCLDTTGAGEQIPLPLAHGRVSVTLAGAGPPLLATHCAGPLATDVLSEIPHPTFTFGQIVRGRRTISLAAAGPFSSHGFAGSVGSSVTVSLGVPGPTEPISSGFPGPTERYRQVQVSYRAALSGSVAERFRGDGDPGACTLLGSCGALGTLTLLPRVTGAEAELTATASLRTPYSDLLHALGASRNGRPNGIRVEGEVAWAGGGAVDSDLHQASTTCVDSAPLGGGQIQLTGTGTSNADLGLEAEYTPAFVTTRCPEPDINLPGSPLAAGLTSLAHPPHGPLRISLHYGGPLSDYGYTGHATPHLTLTLTRIRITTSVLVAPAGTE
jgi:hypothetical protein